LTLPHSSVTPATRAALLLPVLFLLAVFGVSHIGTLHAQTPEPAYSESEAQGIDRMIMCPVCPAETIDQAQVQISMQMRQVVRDMLTAGSDRDEILEFFVDRYGKDILAAPPKSGANLVAWLAPVAGVATALVAVYFILRSMSRTRPVLAVPQPARDAGLIPYLQLVDRHLDMTRIAPGPSGTSGQPESTVEFSGPDDSTDPEENLEENPEEKL
jgi:cytochrome c-type biogenesis protein CcmH